MKVLLIFFIGTVISGERIVNTRNGPVRGILLSPKKVEAFLGIPYAEPPVGNLRFAKPVPKSSWSEIYDAKQMPPTCMQSFLGVYYISPDKRMSEDCLYLNLWIPEGGSDLKPVMLFIHGGAFATGSSNVKIYDGANLAEHGDVIVASINYRVGTLGFFSGFVEEAGGNMALYDQVMAIQWIKDNAENFGGDPNNIVLFGESVGAYSISFHMISPLSRNLFKRAILQSGSAFMPYLYQNNKLLEMSQDIAKYLDCAKESDSLQNNPNDVVNCLKSLPPEKFPEVDIFIMVKYSFFFPRVGDNFLPESPIDVFNKGNFKDTELLLGTNRDEGSFLLSLYVPQTIGVLGEKADSINFNEKSVRNNFQHLSTLFNKKMDSEIIESYFDRVRKDHNYTYLTAMSDLHGDLWITCGTFFQAEYHSLKGNPVYFYRFDYRPDSSVLAEWMGVTHLDELQYVFGNPMYKEFTESENKLSQDVMDAWATFAKTGNPSTSRWKKWPLFTHQVPNYQQISNASNTEIRPDNYRCEIWREFFQAVIDDDTVQRLKNSS